MRPRLAATALTFLALMTSALYAGPVQWRNGDSLEFWDTGRAAQMLLEEASSGAAQRHVILRFAAALTAEDRVELQNAGVQVQRYLGDGAYFAAVARQGCDAAAVMARSAAPDVATIQANWKSHADLQSADAPSWAVIPTPDFDPAPPRPWIAAYVMFHADTTDDERVNAIVDAEGLYVSELVSVDGAVVEMPYENVASLAQRDAVMYIEPALPPMTALNNSNRAETGAEVVQAAPYSLDGSGVSVLVYDGGYARATHQDFGGRLTVRDTSGLADHATHVCGTIGGDGSASGGLYRGMAPGVTIESYGFEQVGGLQPGFLYSDPGDFEADYGDAIVNYGTVIANNSIGTNTAWNGFPCEWTGDYGVTSSVIDSVVRGSLGAPIRVIWANGNERGTSRCGAAYLTTAPPACAKNHITVGALNSNDDSVTYFTSWGPADDGRLKPDLSAPGCQSDDDGGVTSAGSASDTTYTTKCGTSMATPTVTGLAALLLQDFRAQFPTRPDFRPATLKSLLIHNAEDIAAPGPDYQTGYGAVRIQRTIDFMRTDSFLEDTVDQGGVVTLIVNVTAQDPQLRATLAWDDPPAVPLVLNALVNDLDLRVIAPDMTQHYPWTLGGVADPNSPAQRTQADHVNNIEQVLVDTPQPGLWTIEIHGFNVPEGPQPFSICVTPNYAGDCNGNGVPDLDDVSSGTSEDCNGNNVPDECEPNEDCNTNGVTDICDIGAGTSLDVNSNLIPDECETDCNGNGVPDDYELTTGAAADCNGNGIPDACDIASGASIDCDGDGIPDECQEDCNGNGVVDTCDTALGTSPDCNLNGIPDECEVDCNSNGVPDDCDIANGTSTDANGNGFPDECTIVYVDANATGSKSGGNWSDAFVDLQAALTYTDLNVDIQQIRVAAGKYVPGLAGDYTATFQLRSGVELIGGYAGSAKPASPNERDIALYESILSGDIDLNDAPDGTMAGDNVFHVVTSGGTDATAVLDGFTIMGGSTNYGYHVHPTGPYGGGIYNVGGDPTIRNCTIKQNIGSNGSGMYNYDSSPTVVGCTFTLNSVHLNQGAGMYNDSSGDIVVIDCAFISNTLRGGFGQGAGAGIANRGACSLTVIGSMFDHNYSDAFFPSGDDTGTYAGAIYHMGAALTVADCTFSGNRSNQGGAIATWNDATITNCLFVDNQAPAYNSPVGGWGGFGGAVVGMSTAVLTVSGSTFVDNVAEDTGGLASNAGAADNTIFWGNSDNKGMIGTSQVTGPTVNHCCIENMLVGEPGEDPPDPANFPGCIDLDPQFADALAGNYRLSATSPCIDAGDNTGVPLGVLTDLEGRPRFLDDPNTPDTGSGVGAIVDMGAFEFGTLMKGDADGDGDVDNVDFQAWTNCVTGPNGGPVSVACEPMDFDLDNDVDMADLAQFQIVYDGGTPPLDPPASIAGAIQYTGAETGLIYINAQSLGLGGRLYTTTLAAPGPYAIDIDYAADYFVSAFLDVNGDTVADPNEPSVDYEANPISITQAGEIVSGVDMSLGGAMSISGVVTQDGFPLWNTTLTLSGNASDVTTSESGTGAYSFTELAPGSYVVTPSRASRYFYPYFAAVDLIGSDMTGVDFEAHTLPSGEVDGEISGTVAAVDPANYAITIDVGGGTLTLTVYVDTIYSGDASALDEIGIGWDITAQYWTSANLAVEVDVASGQ